RAQVLSLKEREFVEAAQLLDVGWARIVFGEIVPNMASYILINFIIAVTNAIYAMVGLYLLGLAPQRGIHWGIVINDAWTKGAMFNPEAMPYIIAPVTMIVLLQLGLILLTRTLDEILNPRLRDRRCPRLPLLPPRPTALGPTARPAPRVPARPTAPALRC